MSNRCIRFDLYNIYKDIKIQDLADEIKICFSIRADCKVQLEEYRRHFDNMFVTIEVNGELEKIKEAIEEVQYNYNKYCKESQYKVLGKYNIMKQMR